jgi:hypothetical protein
MVIVIRVKLGCLFVNNEEKRSALSGSEVEATTNSEKGRSQTSSELGEEVPCSRTLCQLVTISLKVYVIR